MIDERFRFFLQATADSNIARQCFEEETLRGLNRTNRPGLKTSLISISEPAILNGKDTLAFKVSRSEFEVFFEKIFKALFFKHTGLVFSGQILGSCSHLTFSGEDIRRMIALYKSFESNLTAIHVGEPVVFRYKIATVIESAGKGFLLELTFYDDITVFGLGIEEQTGQQAEVVNSE